MPPGLRPRPRAGRRGPGGRPGRPTPTRARRGGERHPGRRRGRRRRWRGHRAARPVVGGEDAEDGMTPLARRIGTGRRRSARLHHEGGRAGSIGRRTFRPRSGVVDRRRSVVAAATVVVGRVGTVVGSVVATVRTVVVGRVGTVVAAVVVGRVGAVVGSVVAAGRAVIVGRVGAVVGSVVAAGRAVVVGGVGAVGRRRRRCRRSRLGLGGLGRARPSPSVRPSRSGSAVSVGSAASPESLAGLTAAGLSLPDRMDQAIGGERRTGDQEHGHRADRQAADHPDIVAHLRSSPHRAPVA